MCENKLSDLLGEIVESPWLSALCILLFLIQLEC